jgi:beta-lactamase class D
LSVSALELTKQEAVNTNEIKSFKIQSIIDSAKVEGSVLVYDLQKKVYYSNDFEWAKKGNLPASTFKIPNSIIALEIGIVEDDSTLIKWDGITRSFKNWNQDLILKDAFHFSCVPCYQDIAKRIGEKRMNEYLSKFDYGNMKVDSSNIDVFWLEGDSQINQFQQIDFLIKFNESKLPISETTQRIMERLIVIDDNKNYQLSGKTGWSIRNGINNGWFVGYIEKENNFYFFATNIEPKKQFNMEMFPIVRKNITIDALKQLNIIN